LGVTGFRSHSRPRLGVSLQVQAREPVEADPAVALNKSGRAKAEGPKVHIGFRLAADVVASVRASGPGYNVRVEQALRAAGFGAKSSGKEREVSRRRKA
jgi:uncharacterized protein (DUF4415 family)